MSLINTIGRAALRTTWGTALARRTINTHIEKVGRMVTLELNPDRHTLSCSLELKGETEPIRVDIARYEVRREDGKTLLTIHGADASRPWIAALLDQFVVGKTFEIGDQGALPRVLEMLR